MTSIEEIKQLLKSSNIRAEKGRVYIDLANIRINVKTKDVVGNVLQDWFGEWLIRNNIIWKGGPHTQSWPDFILEDGSHLEFKCFDHTKNPAFDLANFDAYIRCLLSYPERLDTLHLVWSYELNKIGELRIKEWWWKHIWEMTGPSATNILELQVKQGAPTNIRPKNWRTGRSPIFRSRREFVQAIAQAIDKFYPSNPRYENWFDKVERAYITKTKNML